MEYASDLQKYVHILLTAAIILYLLTGFGISDYRIVEPLTLGLLSKALAMQLHYLLEAPFILLLALHMYIVLTKKPAKRL